MRVIPAALALLIGCAPASPFHGGRGGGGSSPSGTVYRTTSGGSHVATSKEAPRGGSSNELLKAGLITLAAGYGGTVIGGQVSATLFTDYDREIGAQNTVDMLWVPVIGAWSGLIHNETVVRDNCAISTLDPYSTVNCNLITPASIGIAVGALAQTTGLALTIAGIIHGGSNKGTAAKPGVALQPLATPTGGGFAVSGSW